jgi:hypothetical protein
MIDTRHELQAAEKFEDFLDKHSAYTGLPNYFENAEIEL